MFSSYLWPLFWHPKAEVRSPLDIYSPMWKSIRVPAWELVKKAWLIFFHCVRTITFSAVFPSVPFLFLTSSFFVFRVTGPHIDKVLCTFPLQRFFEFSLQNSWNEHCENLIKCTCSKTSSKVSEKYWFCWIRAFPVLSNQSKCVKIVHSGCLGLRDFT